MKKFVLTLAIASISFASHAQSNLAESKLHEALDQIRAAKSQLNRTERTIREALVELRSSEEYVLTQETIVPNIFSNMCSSSYSSSYLLKASVENVEANLLARCRSRGIGQCNKDLIMIRYTPVDRNACKISGEMRI